MANFVYNRGLGVTAYYATLPGAADALILVPLESSGIETDAVLKDSTDLSDVLGGTTNEQTTMGRKTVTSATVTVVDASDRVDVDIADQTWTGATGNAIGDITIGYDGDTAAGTDANIIPLTNHDFVITPDGSDVTATIANFYQAS